MTLKRIARKAPPKKVNRLRKKREFARTYHSEERVLFVKSLPCVGCSSGGFSENAHIVGGGVGRKADHTKIAPLCGNDGRLRGCHALLHDWGRAEFELHMGVDLGKAAAATERLWQSHTNPGNLQ